MQQKIAKKTTGITNVVIMQHFDAHHTPLSGPLNSIITNNIN